MDLGTSLSPHVATGVPNPIVIDAIRREKTQGTKWEHGLESGDGAWAVTKV